MATPNMSLTLPVVSSTLGPLWAEELNVALELVDLHDHTSGKGVKVPTAGLNINADLSFAGYAALALKHVGMSTGAVDPAIAGAIYVKNGDLYFTSPSITAVQLTDGTSIKGVAGNISGLGDGGSSAAFNDFTEDFTFKFAADNRFAAFNIGEIRLYPFDGVNEYDYPITIKSPLSLAAAYQIELPGSLPLADNVLSVTSAGVVKQGLGNGTAAAPSLAFASDDDTGIYRPSSNVFGITTGGALRAEVSNTAFTIYSTKLFTTGSGSATVPSVVPGSASNTGISGISTTLHTVNNGVATMTITPSAVKAEVALTAAVGLTVETGNVVVSAGNVSASGSLSGSSLSVGSGLISGGAIETSGGGQLKFKYVTGTIAGGANTVVFDTGAGTYAVGRFGVMGDPGNWKSIGTDIYQDYYFTAVNDTRYTTVTNNTGSTRTYRVVIAYI